MAETKEGKRVSLVLRDNAILDNGRSVSLSPDTPI